MGKRLVVFFDSRCIYLIVCFFEPAASTVIGSRSFSYPAPSIWNELPLVICNSSSPASFKRKLKTHYYSHAFSQTRASPSFLLATVHASESALRLTVRAMQMIYPDKRRQSRLKLSQELKGKQAIVFAKYTCVEIASRKIQTYQNKARNLCTIYYVFDLDGECKFIKTKHYSD